MKGEWRWDENENEMNDYLTGTRGGERKRRGKEKTHIDTPGPERAKPWKGKEKEKRRPTDTEQDQRRGGGKDGSAWTNLTKRKPTPTSAREGPDLPREGRTHEIGDQMGD